MKTLKILAILFVILFAQQTNAQPILEGIYFPSVSDEEGRQRDIVWTDCLSKQTKSGLSILEDGRYRSIVIIQGDEFPDSLRTRKHINNIARLRGYYTPTLEQALAIQECLQINIPNIPDADYFGITYLTEFIIMHKPITDSQGDLYYLSHGINNKKRLYVGYKNFLEDYLELKDKTSPLIRGLGFVYLQK